MSRLALPTLLLLAGCSCPPLRESYESPLETLGTFQAQLCREDAEGEYACFSLGFQESMGGFENYFTARHVLLEETPLAILLVLKHADLSDRVTSVTTSPDGRHAVAELRYGDESLEVFFARQTLAELEFADGTRRAGWQALPLGELMGSRTGQNWVLFTVPLVNEEMLRRARSIKLAERWQIDGFSGLDEGVLP